MWHHDRWINIRTKKWVIKNDYCERDVENFGEGIPAFRLFAAVVSATGDHPIKFEDVLNSRDTLESDMTGEHYRDKRIRSWKNCEHNSVKITLSKNYGNWDEMI